VVVAVSCFPGRSTDPSDYDTVTTIYDKAAPFGTYATYALPDSVVHLDTVGQVDNVPHTNDGVILSSIVQSMNGLGYTQVTTAAAADLVVLASAATSTVTGIVVYPYWDYWGWWGGWDGAYGPTWSYYTPAYAVPYTYSTGTLVISILDNKNRSTTTQRLAIIWIGGANGLLSGTNPTGRIQSSVQKMFSASPYLKAK
jgi:hypothetical protein